MGTRPREVDAGMGDGGESAKGAAKRTRVARANGDGLLRKGGGPGEHTVNIHGENPRRIRTCCD